MQRIFIGLLFLIVFINQAKAQKPLPDFLAEDLGNNKIRISWMNPFGESCVQLNVQVSYDSLRNYRTIFSTESPQLPQNGFIYSPTYSGKFYYRIYYILDGTSFLFSKTKQALPSVEVVNDNPQEKNKQTEIKNQKSTGNKTDPEFLDESQPKPPLPPRIITILTKDSVLAQMEYSIYKIFKDSVTKKTRDTLLVLGQDEVVLKPFDPASIYTPSQYITTNQDGFIKLKLPEAATKKYRLIFFENDGKKIFTINHITDTELIIDKTNFLHAGWFKFELYENDKLKERNKILLQRELK